MRLQKNERLTIRHDAGSGADPYVSGTLLAVRKVMKVVEEILGHSSADITYRVYAHATRGMHQEAMEDYNERFKTVQKKDLLGR